MKYFKKGDILLSDFDGVYLNSQEHFEKDMNGEKSLDKWIEYLANIKWRDFLRKCEEMPKATETFLELQELGILKGFITRIHSFEEGIEKSVFIREKGLLVPMHYVLPEQPKSLVYLPNKKTVLLEDNSENAREWESNGGRSIILNPSAKEETKKLVKRLDSLLIK